jgi:FdrA protein
MGEAVEGLMTLPALDALGADPATELIVVIGKPPAPQVRERVVAKLQAIGKPAVVAMLGRDVVHAVDDRLSIVNTLEGAALAASAARRGERWVPRPFALPANEVRRRVTDARRDLLRSQQAIRGLYAGGTLAHEAVSILTPLVGDVGTNLEPGSEGLHQVLDLGADEFTVGRAHPMLDPSSRIEAIGRAAKEPDVGVLVLDVVLGLGAAADPAGDIAPALQAEGAEARAQGRGLAVVATVVGTEADPQGLIGQRERLEAAGAWVLPSNAQAARAAACIAGGEPVLDLLVGAAK